MFDEPPGSYDICSICFWEDDPVQLRHPLLASGANRVSLVAAQANFSGLGACEPRLIEHCRTPTPDEVREPGWRPADTSVDDFEPDGLSAGSAGTGPRDRTTLYYWRDTYWRRAR
jgi:hypothetical protein